MQAVNFPAPHCVSQRNSKGNGSGFKRSVVPWGEGHCGGMESIAIWPGDPKVLSSGHKLFVGEGIVKSLVLPARE